MKSSNVAKRVDFLKEVFQELEKENVSYCILRNYDFLLTKKITSTSELGIDMVVSRNDLSKFDFLLRKKGFFTAKPSFSRKHVHYLAIKKLDLELDKVSFDVQIGGVHWNDMLYLNENHLLKNKIKKSFFYVPSDNDTFVMLLVHSILGKRYFKPEYKRIIISLKDKVDYKYVYERLTSIFNKLIAKWLIVNIRKENFDERNFDKILKSKYSLISYFILKSPKNTGIFVRLFFRWLKWKKLFTKYPLISIVGPDGAGKSTLARDLANYLIENNRKVSLIYTGRGRNHFLPISKIGYKYKMREVRMGEVEKRKEEDKSFDEKTIEKANNITNKTNKTHLLYIAAAPIFALDLLLRYIFRIFPQRMSKKIVITDRYCSDIMLMKNVPFGFKKLLLSIFPKPTMTIYLYNSPEVLHERRPEEPIKELQRQLNIFDKFKYTLRLQTSKQELDKEKVLSFVSKGLFRRGF